MKIPTTVVLKPILTILGLLFVTHAALALEIVRDGKARAEIVVDKEAPAGVQAAARDLKKYLQEISGATLPITNTPNADVLKKIYVGESKFTYQVGYKLPKFTSSGYDIFVTDDYAVLSGPNTIYPPDKFTRKNVKEYQEYMGEKYVLAHVNSGGGRSIPALGLRQNDDIGAWHAVTALLERLGVRFYAPYENGTIVPRKKDIVLNAGRETKQAAFERRIWKHLTDADNEGNLWLSRLGVGAFRGVLSNHWINSK